MLTGAGLSLAGEKSSYRIKIFLCRLLVHPWHSWVAPPLRHAQIEVGLEV